MRWNEFINPRAFAELAVFLKGYQNRCGEVRQGSLVAKRVYIPNLTYSRPLRAATGTEECAQEVGRAEPQRRVGVTPPWGD